MSRRSPRVPPSPQEGWLSDGRQVLRFRPTRWDRHIQRLEVTTAELLPEEPIPLPKNRKELSCNEALKLWSKLQRKGWQA